MKPAKSCLEVFRRDASQPNGLYKLTAADGGQYMAYCDISGGGWTRVFSNTFTKDHAGVTFKIDCPCGTGAGMNNGANAINSNGWHLGVTNCHNANKLSDTIGGATAKYSWRMDFDIPNYGPATAIRHKGINQNNHGYDHNGVWPAGASAITSSVHKNDGEFASAYKGVDGKWKWFAKYSLGAFDIMSTKASVAPYFTYLYSGGGPAGCNEKNSDGFDTKSWEIYAMISQAPPTAPGLFTMCEVPCGSYSCTRAPQACVDTQIQIHAHTVRVHIQAVKSCK